MSEIDEALEAFGGRDARLVTERENAVYHAVLPHGRAAVRLHRPGYQTLAAIRSELDWMRALAEAGIAVPEPLAGPVTLSTGRVATAVRWVEGTPLGEGGAPLPGTHLEQVERFRAVGRAVARLHDVTDALDLGPEFERHAWNIEGLVGDDPLWGRFWENPSLTPPERALVLEARRLARARLEAYAADGGDFGLIHADVLRENVLLRGHEVVLIDFDDAGWGFRLYDLGVFATQNMDEPNADALMEAVVEGYRDHRALSDDDAVLIPVFTLVRRFASMGWIVPRVPQGDPAVRGFAEIALRAAKAFLAGAPGA